MSLLPAPPPLLCRRVEEAQRLLVLKSGAPYLTPQRPPPPHAPHLTPQCPPTPATPPPRPQFRARLWLFISFLIACGAMAGSVAVLINTAQQEHAAVGVVSVFQLGDWAAACSP